MMESRSQREFQQWLGSHRYHHTDFNLVNLAITVKNFGIKVAVIVPAREVAQTLPGVLKYAIEPCVRAGVVSSVFVIDFDSKDGTGAVAAQHGATVIQRARISKELGPSLGKGDGMWRALQVTDGDIVAFLDGDTSDPDPAHLIGILGPLILDSQIYMVRGCFDRPFKQPNGETRPHEGGRVTEIAARPLLNRHFPQLAGFRQPLAGEFAARRSLLEKLSFPVGFGVEIGTLIDTWRAVGLSGLAEVDLGSRQNDHKPLRHLGAMSLAVTMAVERRMGINGAEKLWLPWEERYQNVADVERPPIEEYRRGRRFPMNEVIHVNKSTKGIKGKRENSILESIIPAANGDNESKDLRHKLRKGSRIKSSLGNQQIIHIPGIANFRDIGGFAISTGGSVRRGLIYRSGCPGGLTEEGRACLEVLGISKIFDLRRIEEINQLTVANSVYEPWLCTHHGPSRRILPIFSSDNGSPPDLARMLRLKQYASNSTEGFVQIYRSMLLNSGQALAEILAHLCMAFPSPILVNCTAGKDRTGVVIMALLLLAGCSAKDVARDYHLSEEGLGEDWMTEAIERMHQEPPFVGEKRRIVERVVGAREEVMMDVVAMVEDEWGGIKNFLRQEARIEDKMIEKSQKTLGESNGIEVGY